MTGIELSQIFSSELSKVLLFFTLSAITGIFIIGIHSDTKPTNNEVLQN